MMTPPELRDMVRRLLAYDAIASKNSEPTESATLRVYEKLHQSIDAVAGAAASYSLASRALALAKEEVPSLGAAQVAANGSIQGLSEFETQIDNGMDQADDGGILLIGHLLGLLLIFLGEALTLSLLRNAWPSASFDDRDSENGRKA
jgi:hypothetical protein